MSDTSITNGSITFPISFRISIVPISLVRSTSIERPVHIQFTYTAGVAYTGLEWTFPKSASYSFVWLVVGK